MDNLINIFLSTGSFHNFWEYPPVLTSFQQVSGQQQALTIVPQLLSVQSGFFRTAFPTILQWPGENPKQLAVGLSHFTCPSPGKFLLGTRSWFLMAGLNPILGYNFLVFLTLRLSLCGLTRLMRNHGEARRSGELESQILQVCNGIVLQVTKQGCILNRSQTWTASKILGVS